MKILPIPCLEDNYSYLCYICSRELNNAHFMVLAEGKLIIEENTKQAAVVDPVEPHKILRVAEENGVDLKLVLTTHHHWDHAGGNDKIKQLVPDIKIYGGSVDNVQGYTNKVENGDKLSFGADINILSLHTPCHTKGHISYFVTGKEGEDPAVFTGDTLFIAGCGNFFEGTAEQMYQSICLTLGSLPKPTQIYCSHECQCRVVENACAKGSKQDIVRSRAHTGAQPRARKAHSCTWTEPGAQLRARRDSLKNRDAHAAAHIHTRSCVRENEANQQQTASRSCARKRARQRAKRNFYAIVVFFSGYLSIKPYFSWRRHHTSDLKEKRAKRTQERRTEMKNKTKKGQRYTRTRSRDSPATSVLFLILYS